MTRPFLLALLTIAAALAPPASACTTGMKLADVITQAEKDFDTKPRTTIHECFRPYLKSVDEEDDANTREHFLYLVVWKTAQRPPRPYNLELISDAAEKYFDEMPNTPHVHTGRVLAEWGRAVLRLNRQSGLQTVLGRYTRVTASDSQTLTPELAKIWSAALRCNADPDGCRSLTEFECALKRTCGSDEHVAVYLRDHPADLPPWNDLRERLQAAVKNRQTGLDNWLDEADALLKKVNP